MYNHEQSIKVDLYKKDNNAEVQFSIIYAFQL